MGLSHAAAGGVIFFAAALAGFQISDDAFDAQDASLEAWEAYFEAQQRLSDGSFTIQDADTQPGPPPRTTIVYVLNTGGTSIAADSMSVIVEGTPVAVEAHRIQGAPSSSIWHPGQVLELDVLFNNPTDVLVADDVGNQDIWRGP